MKYFSAGFGIFSHYLTFPFNYLFQKYESMKEKIFIGWTGQDTMLWGPWTEGRQ